MRGFASETILKDHRQEQVRLGSETDLAVRQGLLEHFNLAVGDGVAPEEPALQIRQTFQRVTFPQGQKASPATRRRTEGRAPRKRSRYW